MLHHHVVDKSTAKGFKWCLLESGIVISIARTQNQGAHGVSQEHEHSHDPHGRSGLSSSKALADPVH